jgi:hypothetical protein
MLSVVDRLFCWGRQLFKLPSNPFLPTEVIDPRCDEELLIYRLRRWPKLPSSSMSTGITRTLSVMSTRPVNRRWILNNSSLQAHEVDGMLHRLVEQGAVEVTDAGKYGPRIHVA